MQEDKYTTFLPDANFLRLKYYSVKNVHLACASPNGSAPL